MSEYNVLLCECDIRTDNQKHYLEGTGSANQVDRFSLSVFRLLTKVDKMQLSI